MVDYQVFDSFSLQTLTQADLIHSIDPAIIKRNIRYIAKQLDFDDCRVASAHPATHRQEYKQWIAEGSHGEMKWMERHMERRTHPANVLPGAKTVITLALNYYPGTNPDKDYKIARYAWNEDYHHIIEDKLRDLDFALTEMGGKQRFYVDTGPVLERDYANDAGLGWNGKSTVQIHRHLGTWFFLCELISTLDLEPDPAFGDHCGKCTRCIDACPTGAIDRPHHVDARKCISYLTIEHPDSIPEELRPMMGNRIYGCDDCLDVCPWNKFARLSRETKLHVRQAIFQHSLSDFLKMSEQEFRITFAKSPIKRIKHERFIRNCCVAAGNSRDEKFLPLLNELSKNSNPLIQEHALWAIDQIKMPQPNDSAEAR